MGLGFPALAILAIIFWFFWQRRKANSNGYQRERTPTPEREVAREKGFTPSESGVAMNGAAKEENQRGLDAPTGTHLEPPPVPMFLGSSHRNPSQATSMYDQAFYTPAEQRSFYHSGSEDGRSTHEAVADPPPTLPPIPIQHQGFGAFMGPIQRPERFYEEFETDSIDDPRPGYVSGSTDNTGRPDSQTIHHYPTSNEVERFDFSGDDPQQSNTNTNANTLLGQSWLASSSPHTSMQPSTHTTVETTTSGPAEHTTVQSSTGPSNTHTSTHTTTQTTTQTFTRKPVPSSARAEMP